MADENLHAKPAQHLLDELYKRPKDKPEDAEFILIAAIWNLGRSSKAVSDFAGVPLQALNDPSARANRYGMEWFVKEQRRESS